MSRWDPRATAGGLSRRKGAHPASLRAQHPPAGAHIVPDPTGLEGWPRWPARGVCLPPSCSESLADGAPHFRQGPPAADAPPAVTAPRPGSVGSFQPDGVQTGWPQPTLPGPPLGLCGSRTLVLSRAHGRGPADLTCPLPLGPSRLCSSVSRSSFLCPSADRATARPSSLRLGWRQRGDQ